jgi:hypothetical protein
MTSSANIRGSALQTSSPDVIVYGIDPQRPPSGLVGEHLGRATYNTVLSIAQEHPEVSIGFVDLRSKASWPAQRRLGFNLDRGLRPDDVPFLGIGGRLLRAADRAEVGHALDRRAAGDTGSWEGFFSSPGGNLEYMRRVDREIDTFNLAIVTDPVWISAPVDFRTGWARFIEDWKAFFKRNEGFLARTFADVYDDAKVYEQHLQAWRERWAKLGGKPSAPPSPGANHMLSLPLPSPDALGTTAWGLGALAAVVAGFYLFGSRSR